MKINDPIHGPIEIYKEEVPIIENEYFQRLRNIKQLGFTVDEFPGASHSRFIHSLGAMKVADMVFFKLFGDTSHSRELNRLKETLRMACLLHDVGHAPLSHTTEFMMPSLKDLGVSEKFLLPNENLERQCTHEDYTLKIITDSSLSEAFTKAQRKWGINYERVAELVTGHTNSNAYFNYKGVNYFPILHQLVTSELDCDRMDYLLRDSHFCGVSYGKYDIQWLINHLGVCVIDNIAYLSFNEKAIFSFDDFLLGRFYMFAMIYFHHKPVCLGELLLKYFSSKDNEYFIPSKIEEYVKHDDYLLWKVLRQSKNKYAQSVVNFQTPPKVFESFNDHSFRVLHELEIFLRDNNIEYVYCSSKGKLSKYYGANYQGKVKYPIKVVRKFYKAQAYIDIDQATSIFRKYQEAYRIDRLHFDMKDLDYNQQRRIKRIIAKEVGMGFLDT